MRCNICDYSPDGSSLFNSGVAHSQSRRARGFRDDPKGNGVICSECDDPIQEVMTTYIEELIPEDGEVENTLTSEA